MRTMLSLSLGKKQKTATHTVFCNYLVSEVEEFEEKDFKTFRNKSIKLLSKNQSRAEECGRQVQQPETLLQSSSPATRDTFTKLKCHFNLCARLFQQPYPPALVVRECILTISERQMATRKGMQPHSDNQRTAAAIQRAADFLPSC